MLFSSLCPITGHLLLSEVIRFSEPILSNLWAKLNTASTVSVQLCPSEVDTESPDNTLM